LQIYGQEDRELVLSRLYLLHASTSNTTSDTASQEVLSSSCSTAESVFVPTAVRVRERERVDSDLVSDPVEDVPASGYCILYCVSYCFQPYTQIAYEQTSRQISHQSDVIYRCCHWLGLTTLFLPDFVFLLLALF